MKVLVLGASTNPTRASNRAVHLLRSLDYSTVAIGRTESLIGGLRMLTGMPKLTDIDTISLYMNPGIQEDYYQYIIAVNPKRVIFNPGTENESLYKLLDEYNIGYETACTLVLLQTGQF